jgi:type I restriction enzyme R subunit
MTISESVVEEAALAWLEDLGYAIKHGPEIAPGVLFTERKDYDQVMLWLRLSDALAKLNPDLRPEALDNAFREIISSEGPTLKVLNLSLSYTS